MFAVIYLEYDKISLVVLSEGAVSPRDEWFYLLKCCIHVIILVKYLLFFNNSLNGAL